MLFRVPKNFVLAYSADQIRSRLEVLAEEISPWLCAVEEETGEQALAICVLRGGAFFFADLLRAFSVSVEPMFCRASSYSSEQNEQVGAQVNVSLESDCISGRGVLLVDDICDTGATLARLSEIVRERGAREVKSAVLIHRQVPESTFAPAWAAFVYPGREWFVGYGMEDRNHFSNLPEVYLLQK